MECEYPGCPGPGELRAIPDDPVSPLLCLSHWLTFRVRVNDPLRVDAP